METVSLSAPVQLSAPDTDKRTIKAFAYTTDVEFEQRTAQAR